MKSGNRLSSRVVALSLILACTGQSSLAFCQASAESKAEAEALFDRGLELMRQGNFADSCQLLEQSQRVDPGVGTLLYLGECYEKSGRLASAWATFREATSSARASGQADRARQGQERADRLTPKLAKLRIAVDEANRGIQGIEVSRSGTLVSSALWGVPAPVDQGEQTIVASAPGYKTFTHAVRVEGQGTLVEVTVPALERDAAAPPVAATPNSDSGSAPAASEKAPPPAEGNSGSGQRTLAYVVGAVGVVGIGIGSYFGLRAINKNSDAKELCPRGDRCDTQEGVTLTERASDAAVVSNIAFGAGGVLLGTAIVLLLTAPSSTEATASSSGAHQAALQPRPFNWGIAPPIGKAPGGVFMRGSF